MPYLGPLVATRLLLLVAFSLVFISLFLFPSLCFISLFLYLLFSRAHTLLSLPVSFSLPISYILLKRDRIMCTGTSCNVAQQNLKLPCLTETVGACYSRHESRQVCAGESHYFEPPRNHLSYPASPNTTMILHYIVPMMMMSQMLLVEF